MKDNSEKPILQALEEFLGPHYLLEGEELGKEVEEILGRTQCCDQDFRGSHYHCAYCNKICGMMGHEECIKNSQEQETIIAYTPKSEED